MRFRLCICAVIIFTKFSFSQSTEQIGVWLDHLPYGSGVEIIQNGNQLYCAVEQGLFTFDLQDRDIQRLSKLNGLNDVNVNAMAFSAPRNEIILGYENANIDIVRGEEVINIPEITLSANYPGLKTINHLYTYTFQGKNLCYVSTDFGIVVVDLDLRIIKDTYIIGENGENLKVNQLAVNPLNDSIYAATDKGIFKASLNSSLQFFETWKRDPRLRSRIKQVTYFNETIFANKEGAAASDSIFSLKNGTWRFVPEIGLNSYDYLEEKNGYLITCFFYGTQAFDTSLTRVFNVNYAGVEESFNSFNPQAALVDARGNNVMWIMERSKGLYLVVGDPFYYENILPNSPASKKVYKMHSRGERLYVAPGSVDGTWAPLYNTDGLYILEDFFWTNYNYAEFDSLPDVVAIISDPKDPTHFYASSYDNGIAEFEKDEYVRIINKNTVGKENLPGIGASGLHRVGGFSYDPDGNLWFTNSLTDKPLGVIRPDGSVESFGLGSAVASSTAIKDLMYTAQDQIWIQTRGAGVVVARFNGEQIVSKKLLAIEGQGNLPTETVLCFAEDKDGEVWVGTNEGVAVLYSPKNIFEPNRNYDTQRILIDDDGDGYGEPFLGGESVNDIEVDGSNKKWFATGNSGVFYTSDDGRQQIYHFTKENSPLLSNTILDIELDDNTGMVYFATDQGIVSFQGVATEGADFNDDVYAYPNPVQPGYSGPILIRGLVTNAQVKITDIEGNIVYETIAEGGQAIWSGKKFDGTRASSGVYLAYITNDLGTSTAIAKILIIN